jgi:hypothetical protein
MRRYWFWEINGGVGFITPMRGDLLDDSTGPQPVGGASIGFRTRTQTLLASYERSVGDAYGYSAEATSNITAAWEWRLGQSWWLESDVTWSELPGAGIDMTSWRATAGLGRALGSRTALLMQVAYLHYSGHLESSPFDSSQVGVRLSFIWNLQRAIIR